MSEKLRSNENSINSNSLAKGMSVVVSQQVTISELSSGAYSYEDEKATTRTTELHAAISTLIAKLTVLEDLTENIIANYSSMSLEEVEVYERVFFFVRKNCNGVLREALEAACNYINDHCSGFFADEEFVSYDVTL